MIRLFIPLAFVLIISEAIHARKTDSLLYNPLINAMAQIDEAISQAAAQNKHVLIQVGGNWCPWCIRIHQFIKTHYSLDSLVQADYILIHLNYSKENKNPEAMARLEYPQRFGFPVFVVLDGKGKRLHTQNTAYLEEGELYSEEKIADFLKNWNRKAVDQATYLKK
jgi:thioredoxin-related protein